MKKETINTQSQLTNTNKSSLTKYQELIVGKKGFWSFLKYEIMILIPSLIPGALGLFLRMKIFPLFFRNVGKNVMFGRNVVIRHSHKISLGDNVIIDDNVVLDAKGTDNNGITIGNNVFIGRNTILNCKNGDIVLGDNVNIGFNCYIFSASRVVLDENALIAAYCYFIGGTHKFDNLDVAPLFQERESKGITIKKNVWIGSNVQILDGVNVGSDCIIGTSAVVNTDIPEYSIAVGIPAKAIKKRK